MARKKKQVAVEDSEQSSGEAAPESTGEEMPQAEETTTPVVEQPAQAQTAPVAPGSPPSPPEPPKPKSYSEVITDEAISQEGMISVHRVGTNWYFELTPEVLGKDMIWYAEFAEAPYGVANNPKELGKRVVRWERFGNHIEVRDRTGSMRLRPKFAVASEQAAPDPEDLALEAVAFPSILYSFPVVAEDEEGTAVIDVTAFFAGNLLDFDVTPILKGAGYMATAPDPLRSRIERIGAFPKNVLVHALLTFALVGGSSSAASIVVAHSLVMLPEKPMLPREYDPRIGYFTTDFGVVDADDEPGIVTKQFISRFRLEKQDPEADLSDPVLPITFYLPPEIPQKWRPYVRQGIEDWQPAFEAAGFSNAILGIDAPDDPTWDPADARYSVIRWVPQPFPNAMGPHLADPRTGQILSAHVIFWDDVLKVAETWYFSQVSAVDERAQRLPLLDDLLGEVVRYIVCHEVGHSIGLRHNHRASQAYTTEQLRDPAFAAEHGPVASIMSYGRFNYVTQPDDGVERLMPLIGPYDLFAVNWGYRPIPEADSPQAEEAVLNEWASAVRDNPWLEFGGEDFKATVDPTVLTENVGADRIESARLGIANLERMLDFLVPATTQDHEGFDLLSRMYKAIVGNRTTWLVAAAKELGGVVERRTLAAGEEPFKRVTAERQHQILAFLLENLRHAQVFLRPDIVNRIMPVNAIKPVMDSQTAILDALLAGGVYKQMMDATILEPESAYQLPEYLNDIKEGLFAEIKEDEPVIDAIMRASQRHFLTTIKQLLAAYENKLDPMLLQMIEAFGFPSEMAEYMLSSGQGTDFRNASRVMLRQLRGELAAALERVSDMTTKAHLEDLLQEVDQMLSGAQSASSI
ncbi:MAG: zinc-dependent metalloprotease [Candidatus Promineifilaceae bacterium]